MKMAALRLSKKHKIKTQDLVEKFYLRYIGHHMSHESLTNDGCVQEQTKV